MRRHVVDGAEILRRTPEIPSIAPVVAFEHHLRSDGTGYPVGVSRPKLNLATMLCSIADVYDAMRSQRAYQGSLPTERILEVMKQRRRAPVRSTPGAPVHPVARHLSSRQSRAARRWGDRRRPAGARTRPAPAARAGDNGQQAAAAGDPVSTSTFSKISPTRLGPAASWPRSTLPSTASTRSAIFDPMTRARCLAAAVLLVLACGTAPTGPRHRANS